MKKSNLLGISLFILILFAVLSYSGYVQEGPVEEWVATYHSSSGIFRDKARAIAVDPSSGNIYVTGRSRRKDYPTVEEYATVAYNSLGEELWVARYSGPEHYRDHVYAIAVDPSTGNVYVTGWSFRELGAFHDYATVAYDSSGEELWVATYSSEKFLAGAWDIAVDSSSGNVYVTGWSYGSETYRDYATVAYSSLGEELWVAKYNCPEINSDEGRAIAVDSSSGNVYVTGISRRYGIYNDYATVAYNSLGEELWVARYNGPGNRHDYVYDIAVDPSSGNVYVTGSSLGIDTSGDFATVAYNSSGEELWVARYDGPVSEGDAANAIAVDSATGDVYVTGQSHGGITFYDYATVAYNSSGEELWVARYDGPDNDTDYAHAIAVDSATGDVYVTGQSCQIDSPPHSTYHDYATVAYDNSGNQLWVARYNSPTNHDDKAHAIAVDSSTGSLYVTGEAGVGYTTIKYLIKLDPVSQIKKTIEAVEKLVNDGVLNEGQGNALIVKLEGTLEKLNKGNTRAACNQLQAFINQVSAFMNSGILTEEQGQPLIDAAKAVIDVLCGE